MKLKKVLFMGGIIMSLSTNIFARVFSYPIYKIVAEKTRKDWAANDAKRDANFNLPETIQITEDIIYGPYGKYNTLNVYRPKTTEKLPCILNFHGGGFFYGDAKTYQYYSADLATRDFVVVCFNYRLCPEKIFPSPLEDANNAYKWLISNADKYNIDLDKIFFVGDSAGANLAITYATMVYNQDYAKLYKLETPVIKPKALGLNSSLFDLELATDKMSVLLRKAYVGRLTEKKKEMLCFNKFITEDFPPCYITSAPGDFLLYQNQYQIDSLNSKGIENKFKIYGTEGDPNAVHVFHLNLVLDIAKECNDEECEFFKQNCF